MAIRHAPRDCPVCGTRLALTRLSCEDCGTELSGSFVPCEFCALTPDDRTLLRVFLASRGNMKELERHLAVSYPTARARLDALLGRIGIEPQGGGAEPVSPPVAPTEAGVDDADDDESLDVLESLSRGDIDVEQALRRLG